MKTLFEPARIGPLTLKNRLVRSATHEGMADDRGGPAEALFRLYRRLAEGGAGMIITGFAAVTPAGRGAVLRQLMIDRDDLVPDYRRLVDHVHDHGARIAVQLAHCGRQTTAEAAGCRPLAPSAVRDKSLFVTPREMTERDIQEVIAAFGRAAERARKAGFDAVQIHGAHGYLVNQFLSPYTNRRSDAWGGAFDNRMRFPEAVVRACRDAVGPDFPVMIKINHSDALRGGLSVDEGVRSAVRFAELGVDALEVSCGVGEDGLYMFRGDVPIGVFLDEWPMYRRRNPLFKWMMRRFGRRLIPPRPVDHAYNRDSCLKIRRLTDIPLMMVGGLTEPAAMAQVIADGEADFLSLSRTLIADPGFPRKLASGDTAPARCVHCNLCVAYMPVRPLACYQGRRLPPSPH